MSKFIAEYIWIDGENKLRSKARTLNQFSPHDIKSCSSKYFSYNQSIIPNWNYDGSSTKQANGSDSEIILIPRYGIPCPFRKGINILVMCETYKSNMTVATNNNRLWAKEIFDKKLEEKPWFGIEQEYFAFKPVDKKNLERAEMPPSDGESLPAIEQGKYYCSVGMGKAFYRELVDQHLYDCLSAGLKISGINAEVAPYQWEYQIGPCTGIEAGDEVWISRYLLERLGEKYGVEICYLPKPFKKLNGSGCHTNFSTKSMREDNGIEEIFSAIKKLSGKHIEHMSLYGDGNHERMSGLYETSKYDVFSFDIKRPVDRGASVRI